MQAIKCVTKVKTGGQVILPQLQLKPGTPVEVIVLVSDHNNQSAEEPAELMAASESSLAFWDNATDDEVWNDA